MDNSLFTCVSLILLIITINFPIYNKVWTGEFVLGDNSIIPHPHYNNGHPLLQQSYMNGKLFFGVTETAIRHGGYMEGAVIAAQSVADKLTT